ncbi:MAG: hypothetical protein ACFUZC_16925 [Chthoniobacteraceae bacterium]
MPSGPSDIGITQASASLLESVEWETKLEEKTIKATDGSFGQGQTFDPTIEFSVKGRGTSTVAVGIGAAGIAAITGGTTLILKVKYSQKNDDFESFEYSGTNYPNA